MAARSTTLRVTAAGRGGGARAKSGSRKSDSVAIVAGGRTAMPLAGVVNGGSSAISSPAVSRCASEGPILSPRGWPSPRPAGGSDSDGRKLLSRHQASQVQLDQRRPVRLAKTLALPWPQRVGHVPQRVKILQVAQAKGPRNDDSCIDLQGVAEHDQLQRLLRRHRRAARQVHQVDHAQQPAAYVGQAAEPWFGPWHRCDLRKRHDFPGAAQIEQIARVGKSYGEPGRLGRLARSRAQALGQLGREIPQAPGLGAFLELERLVAGSYHPSAAIFSSRSSALTGLTT